MAGSMAVGADAVSTNAASSISTIFQKVSNLMIGAPTMG